MNGLANRFPFSILTYISLAEGVNLSDNFLGVGLPMIPSCNYKRSFLTGNARCLSLIIHNTRLGKRAVVPTELGAETRAAGLNLKTRTAYNNTSDSSYAVMISHFLLLLAIQNLVHIPVKHSALFSLGASEELYLRYFWVVNLRFYTFGWPWTLQLNASMEITQIK